MSRRIITVSFTSLNAGGGVPAFNRALHAAFPDRECVHYCWDDFYGGHSTAAVTEWEKAKVLNRYLLQTHKVTNEDIVIADGFWAAGLESLPHAVSHSHGIWSHLTNDDVMDEKAPDMPLHHAAQVAFRHRWLNLKKHHTSVSEFITNQMRLQWGFTVEATINNGVDTSLWHPARVKFPRLKPIVVHGVNDRGNKNKGWNHIEALTDLDCEVLSLDDMTARYGGPAPWALAQADVVVHPSGFEGNSMFVAEALACGVPFVGYDVGFAWKLRRDGDDVGWVLNRQHHHPLQTLDAVQAVLNMDESTRKMFGVNARAVAEKHLSLTKFNNEWRQYVDWLEEPR